MVRQMVRQMVQQVVREMEQKVEQEVEQHQQVCCAGWRMRQVSVEPTRAAVADIQFQDLFYDLNTCTISLDPQLLWMKEKVSDGVTGGCMVANLVARVAK